MQYVPRAPDNTWGTTVNEMRADRELAYANAPAAAPHPVVLFRPRVGYPSYKQRQITIEDIIDVPRIYSDPRTTFTGTPAGYSGTSRPSMGNGF